MNYRTAFYYVSLALMVSACTITKRQYNNGYHFEWRKHYSSNNDIKESFEEDLSVQDEEIKTVTVEKTQKISSQEETTKNIGENKHTKVQVSNHQKLIKFEPIKVVRKHLKLKENASFVKNSTEFVKKKKQQFYIGDGGLRTPREYLIAALACLIGGVVLVGLAALLIVVVEVEGLSIGGLFVFLMLIIGFACLIAVPISLLLALFSYLYYL